MNRGWWYIKKITMGKVLLYKRMKDNGIIIMEMAIDVYVKKEKIFPEGGVK